MLNKAALKVVVEGTKPERKYLCEKDFSLFFTYYFVDYMKYDHAPFHFEMFKDLHRMVDGELRELAWVAFRESAKTSIVEAFLVWCIVYSKRKYINVDSLSKTNSERILYTIVNTLQTNPRIIDDFGQLYNAKRTPEESTMKRQGDFVTNNGVRVEAHTTGTSVRGRKHKEQRPDLLVLDDFETNETIDSDAKTSEVIGHIDEFKSGLSGDAWVIYLGNYISEYGSVQTILERAKNDFRLKVMMVNVEIDGKPAWPAKYAMTDAEAKGTNKISLEDKKRQLGSQVYMKEMMNTPIDDSIAEFKKEWFKTIKSADVEKLSTRNFGTIDPAYSKKDSADDIGMCINHVNSENKWHLRAWGAKMSPKELIDTMFVLWDRYKLEAWGVEEGVFDLILKEFIDDEMRKRNKFITIVKLKHNGVNKETRIRGLLPRYESGSIYHIEGECTKLEEQARTFPRGLHDDVIDAVAYQPQIAKKPYDFDEFEEEEPVYSDIGI